MPTINRSALVMHSVEKMYSLINDVLAYPKFLPDCTDSRIISADEKSMSASLLVAKGGISKWFTTKNTLVKNQQIKMNLVDGPFKQLVGCWTLTPLAEDACKINLELEYEFANKIIGLAFGRVFTHLANNMVQAFTSRANEVHGTNV